MSKFAEGLGAELIRIVAARRSDRRASDCRSQVWMPPRCASAAAACAVALADEDHRLAPFLQPAHVETSDSIADSEIWLRTFSTTSVG